MSVPTEGARAVRGSTDHDARSAIAAAVAAQHDALRDLALDLHAHPETAFEEHRSAATLVALLEGAGFDVEAPVAGLETAFVARHAFGPGGPRIALLAEYDALPGLGHACGHNLISAASVGAARALRQHLDARAGELWVVGTPAEEGGGGKIIMLEHGVFDGVDAAMMFHAGARTMTTRGSLAATRVTMRFHGRAAHAAANPHLGVNALDACIQTFNAVNALRQHVRDETRIHGIISHGGEAANITPAFAEAKFIVRHRRHAYVQELLARVKACAEGAAASVGATVTFEEGLAYAERRVNGVLAERFRVHLEAQGEPVVPPLSVGGVGSSDFGNLSQVVPAIHPYVAIVNEGTSAHTPEFAEAAASPAGMRAVMIAATALALTAHDLFADPDLLQRVKDEFARESDGPVSDIRPAPTAPIPPRRNP
jgi:amidohydrolase